MYGANRSTAAAVGLAVLVLCGGCGDFRGIPSHGGGKRFDEEQRLIAGSVRYTLSRMKLPELRGRRVQIAVQSIAHVGGGNISFPGFETVNLSASGGLNSSERNTAVPYRDLNDSCNISGGASTSIRVRDSYYTHTSPTSEDFDYLRAALEMKARHDELVVVGEDPDAILFVLVDVLGTNRSHLEQVFRSRERLTATCEVTYYAQNARTGEMIFRARQSAGMAVYEEQRSPGMDRLIIHRDACAITPTVLPVDGELTGPPRSYGPTTAGASDAPDTPEPPPPYREVLVQNARMQIRINDRQAASTTLQQLQSLDPTDPDLPRLVEDYRKQFGGP